MALVSVANLNFHFGDEVLLDGVNLSVERGEHVGLVGRNGCGKSTLLKLIAAIGPGPVESGQIQVAGGASTGYLEQDPTFDHGHTLRQEAGAAFAELDRLHHQLDQAAAAMAEAEGDDLENLIKRYGQLEEQIQTAGGYAVDHKIEQTLHGLGLTDEFFDVPVTELSGGQRGRLALAKLLLTEPDVLLLDEPTNHLDIAGRQWLEQFLAGYQGAVILISHDRWLLNRVVRRIYELEHGGLIEYPGNYDQYREQRHQRQLELRRKVDKQQQKIRQEQAFIDRYRAGQRSKQAQGREKRLERYKRDEQIDLPPEIGEMKLSLAPKKRSGDIVANAKQIGVTYDGVTLFDQVALSIERGDRIGVIGPNGAGKSTLVRTLIGEQQPTAGQVRLGASLDVGYFRQTHEHLNLDRTVIEHLQPYTENQTEQQARDLAGAFLFSGIEQEKQLRDLSGGERSRTLLAALVAGRHNLLVFDEPTNHLDIPSADRLEEALSAYREGQSGQAQGTLILITHDRMLLDHLVDQLLIFDGQGSVRHFLGTYSDYLDTLKKEAAQTNEGAKNAGDTKARKTSDKSNPPKSGKTRSHGSGSKKSTHGSRNANQSNRSRKSSKPGGNGNRPSPHRGLSAKQLETRIVEIETKRSEIDAQLADPEIYRDPPRYQQLEAHRRELENQLQPLEFEWSTRAE